MLHWIGPNCLSPWGMIPHFPSPGVLQPWPPSQIQPVVPCHLAHRASHGLRNLEVGEWWHCSLSAKFLDLWGALGPAQWSMWLILVHRARQEWCWVPGPNPSMWGTGRGWCQAQFWCTNAREGSAKSQGTSPGVLRQKSAVPGPGEQSWWERWHWTPGDQSWHAGTEEFGARPQGLLPASGRRGWCWPNPGM